MRFHGDRCVCQADAFLYIETLTTSMYLSMEIGISIDHSLFIYTHFLFSQHNIQQTQSDMMKNNDASYVTSVWPNKIPSFLFLTLSFNVHTNILFVSGKNIFHFSYETLNKCHCNKQRTLRFNPVSISIWFRWTTTTTNFTSFIITTFWLQFYHLYLYYIRVLVLTSKNVLILTTIFVSYTHNVLAIWWPAADSNYYNHFLFLRVIVDQFYVDLVFDFCLIHWTSYSFNIDIHA